MNRTALITAAYYAVRAMGEDPTRRSVTAMLYRISGRAFRHNEVLDVLALLKRGPIGDQQLALPGTGVQSETLATQDFVAKPGPGTNGVGDHSHARPKGVIVRSITLPSVEAPGFSGPEWATTLREKIVGLRKVELKDLSIDDRILLGRWHALRFAYCNKDESNNRVRGTHVAAQLATLCMSPQFGDFTVAEYLAKARQYHLAIAERPWFRPWDIKAVVESDVLERSRNGAAH